MIVNFFTKPDFTELFSRRAILPLIVAAILFGFGIQMAGGAETKIYTTGLKVNGHAHDRAWIDWKELSNGATLEFTTSAKPAGRWGQSELPPSYE